MENAKTAIKCSY